MLQGSVRSVNMGLLRLGLYRIGMLRLGVVRSRRARSVEVRICTGWFGCLQSVISSRSLAGPPLTCCFWSREWFWYGFVCAFLFEVESTRFSCSQGFLLNGSLLDCGCLSKIFRGNGKLINRIPAENVCSFGEVVEIECGFRIRGTS